MEILGVGLEIVDQRRWTLEVERNKKFFSENFTLRERNYCKKKRNPIPHYSARLACKKAVFRALDLRGRGEMKKIEVLSHDSGHPKISLSPHLLSKKRNWLIEDIKASLSHSDHHAAAEVMVLGQMKKRSV
ncbi:MAG: 4'-phosphopantetheinyl transferase superfamily protein [Chlamydiae bacterium]|nr:4'-phosphopantetheinyl transferase superfamily protein [Chlamydiota bacterium]MBI3266629.1 4'-phosphopantetheinyl transferase superfamily protein [Chlamydiota bacterium]